MWWPSACLSSAGMWTSYLFISFWVCASALLLLLLLLAVVSSISSPVAPLWPLWVLSFNIRYMEFVRCESSRKPERTVTLCAQVLLKFAGELALFRYHIWTTLTRIHTGARHTANTKRRRRRSRRWREKKRLLSLRIKVWNARSCICLVHTSGQKCIRQPNGKCTAVGFAHTHTHCVYAYFWYSVFASIQYQQCCSNVWALFNKNELPATKCTHTHTTEWKGKRR